MKTIKEQENTNNELMEQEILNQKEQDIRKEMVEESKLQALNEHNMKLLGDFANCFKSSTLPHFVKEEDRNDVMKHCEDDYKLLLGVE